MHKVLNLEAPEELRPKIGVSEPPFTSVNLNVGSWRLSLARRTARASEVAAIYDRDSVFWAGAVRALGYPGAYREMFGSLRRDGLVTANTQAVVDCGIGTGCLASAFAQSVAKDANVYGVDLSARMLHRARHHLRLDNVRLRATRADALMLPFDDACFDLVMTAHTLEHAQRPQDVVREMVRVLRPGGALLAVITRPGALDPVLRMIWRYRRLSASELRRWMWESGVEPLGRLRVGGGRRPARWLSVAVLGRKPYGRDYGET